jgi:hypothetical protein
MLESRIIGSIFTCIQFYELTIPVLSRLVLLLWVRLCTMMTLLAVQKTIVTTSTQSALGQFKAIVSHPSFQSCIWCIRQPKLILWQLILWRIMLKMELSTTPQIVVQVEHPSICLHHCEVVNWSLFDSIHTPQHIRMYIPLKGSCIARRHSTTCRKPKKRIQSILATKVLPQSDQSPKHHNYMAPYNFNIWIRKVNCFRLSPSFASLIRGCRQANCSL